VRVVEQDRLRGVLKERRQPLVLLLHNRLELAEVVDIAEQSGKVGDGPLGIALHPHALAHPAALASMGEQAILAGEGAAAGRAARLGKGGQERRQVLPSHV